MEKVNSQFISYKISLRILILGQSLNKKTVYDQFYAKFPVVIIRLEMTPFRTLGIDS